MMVIRGETQKAVGKLWYIGALVVNGFPLCYKIMRSFSGLFQVLVLGGL